MRKTDGLHRILQLFGSTVNRRKFGSAATGLRTENAISFRRFDPSERMLSLAPLDDPSRRLGRYEVTAIDLAPFQGLPDRANQALVRLDGVASILPDILPRSFTAWPGLAANAAERGGWQA